jgi:hypothetical protein
MWLRLSVVVLTVLLPGLGGQASLAGDNKEKPPAKDDASWEYQAEEFGFTLRLPSTAWKEYPKGKGPSRISFHAYWAYRSIMVAGVAPIKKETEEQFQKENKARREQWEKAPRLLAKPHYEEGKTKEGNPYIYLVAREKGKGEFTYFYLATSRVWLKDKGLTVEVFFEGQARSLSRTFQVPERAAFEKTARDICLSVK